MLAEERMDMFDCTNLTRVILTSHTRLRDKPDRTCKGFAVAFVGVADGGHQKGCTLAELETADKES